MFHMLQTPVSDAEQEIKENTIGNDTHENTAGPLIPLIDIQGLTRGYPKSDELLFNNFFLQLHEEDFCFIVGKSGVGKTTLVKFLMRQLLPPTRMIFHNKEDIARYSTKEVQVYRQNVGVIFQDFKLIDWKNVYENIIYPLRLDGTAIDQTIEERIDMYVDLLGLAHKKYASIPELSGGEKQRVAIARALIRQPQFLIADEPTGNIDTESARNIADLLIRLNKKGHTILFITHDQSLIEYVTEKHSVKMIELF